MRRLQDLTKFYPQTCVENPEQYFFKDELEKILLKIKQTSGTEQELAEIYKQIKLLFNGG